MSFWAEAAVKVMVAFAQVSLATRWSRGRASHARALTEAEIRPLLAEVKRYGPYSRSGEFAYDRPFLWGSKRTGPDLARIGGRYSDTWHRLHLLDPRSVVPKSIMPAYPWLATHPADRNGSIRARMRTLVKLGHPYSAGDIEAAPAALEGRTELDAVIAYLQSMGRSMQGEPQP